MSRLFITPRERNFFSDIAKEVIKDVIGQKIYVYSISEKKSSVHDVYNESVQKVYDQVISIDALVASPEIKTEITEFGPDQKYTVEAWVQYRDMVDKGIDLAMGDFFSFGEVIYEITDITTTRNIYGIAEDKDGLKVIGTKARESLLKSRVFGPTDREFTDTDAIQTTFNQQKGDEFNVDGQTADRRELIVNGTLDQLPKHTVEVSEKGDPEGVGSSFYGDDE